MKAAGSGNVILDGPMGTELARRAVALPLPAWSATAIDTAPEIIAAIHGEYARAGATVHTATTFRSHKRAVGAGWEELTRRAVQLARAAVPTGQRVAGSIAPLEDCYRPDLSPGLAARAEHAAMVRALVSAGVDLLLCETFPHPVEARVAVEAAAETGVETWVALTPGPDGSLLTPEAMRAAARSCIEGGAQVVLVNCVAARRTLPYVRELASLGVPFGAYANAGGEADGIGWGTADDPRAATAYASLAASWIGSGATIVGGCCGTGPAHIREVARAVSARA
jgi:S-methylmethionine-dependent homocysteine/selenocysteine methylase